MERKEPGRGSKAETAGRWATGMAGAGLVCAGVDEATAAWATGAVVAVMISEVIRDHGQSKIPFLACSIAAAAAGLVMPEAASRQAALALTAAAGAVSAAGWRAQIARRPRRRARSGNRSSPAARG